MITSSVLWKEGYPVCIHDRIIFIRPRRCLHYLTLIIEADINVMMFHSPYIELVHTTEWKRKLIATEDLSALNACWQRFKFDPRIVSHSEFPQWAKCWNRWSQYDEIHTPLYYYQLESEAVDSDEKFRYPIPLSTPRNVALGESAAYSNLLFAKVPRTSFTIGAVLESLDSEALFINDEGHNVGSIRIDEDFFLDINQGESCELIGISRGRFWPAPCRVEKWVNKFYDTYWENDGKPPEYGIEKQWPFEEWDTGEDPRSKSYYEFVNVLWIEWKDDIAYRKALGKVMKSAWDRKNPEMIDLVLG